jgi:hypothetical protein
MPITGCWRDDVGGERLQVRGFQFRKVSEIGQECLQARLQFFQPARWQPSAGQVRNVLDQFVIWV